MSIYEAFRADILAASPEDAAIILADIAVYSGESADHGAQE